MWPSRLSEMFLNIWTAAAFPTGGVWAERARGPTLTLEHVINTRNGSWTVMDGGCYSSNPPGVPRHMRISIADLCLQGTQYQGRDQPIHVHTLTHSENNPSKIQQDKNFLNIPGNWQKKYVHVLESPECFPPSAVGHFASANYRGWGLSGDTGACLMSEI